MTSCPAGSRVAATADLAGEDAPALFTIGKDGAVFYWMYDAASPNMRPTPQGYAQIPGKHRKRKAPGSDPIQPKTALVGDKAAVGDKEVGEATEDGDRDSSSDDSSGGESSGGSERREKDGRETVEAGQSPATGASAGITENSADMQTSTSGRTIEDQQQQTMSFTGEQSTKQACCCTRRVVKALAKQADAASAYFLVDPTIWMYALPCPALPCLALPCPALPCLTLLLVCLANKECVRARASASPYFGFGLHVFLVLQFRQKPSLLDPLR